MKTIKINYSCMWENTNIDIIKDRFLFGLLDDFCFVESDDPDFIFVSCRGTNFEYLSRDAILIFYTNENTHPDFEFFDYCIGYNSNLSFGDRYCYYLPAEYSLRKFLPHDMRFPKISKEEASLILKEKDLFCDFIYNHDNEKKIRKHYLDLLNTYKKVTVAGKLYNDHYLDGENKYNYDYVQKNAIQKRCKFSIVVESSVFSGGLITEKIFHSIIANTIPIFYGEQNISSIVNPKRFINAKNYTDSELIDLIKKIDADDDMFEDIISQAPLIDDYFFSKQQDRLTNFLKNIFSQNVDSARRKPNNELVTKYIKDRIVYSDKMYNDKFIKFLYKIKKRITKRR